MKITDIKTLRLRASLPPEGQVMSRTGLRTSRSALLVEVRTDEGMTGIGSCPGNGPVIEAIIERILKPILVGRDPTKIEELWEECYFRAGVRAFGSRGIGVVALGAIDIALWDILGKVKNAPLYQLLGKTRDKVEVYATALYPETIPEVVRKAEALAEKGFRGLKIKIGFDLAKDIEAVKAVRSCLGKGYAIMTDANMGYEAEVAVRACSQLAEFDVAWLEEPLFLEDIEGHAFLKSRSQVPVAVGENLNTRFAFQDYLSRKAVDILQPDVARAGGVSETLKIAALASVHDLPVSLHTYGDAVTLAASLHLAAALENSQVMELDFTCNPLRTELLKEPLEMRGSFMSPPEGPGLGIELNPLVLEKYRFSGHEEVSLRQKAIGSKRL